MAAFAKASIYHLTICAGSGEHFLKFEYGYEEWV